MPERIQRKRAKGWKMPEGAVYVGRPTKWGNPFTGQDAVERYRKAVSEWPLTEKTIDEWMDAGGSGGMLICLARRNPEVLNELRGKDLACWCPLTKKDGTPYPCHADVLLEIANHADDWEK